MKNAETMADQTARDLFGMVFDEGGVAVPPDDLAPAAMAGYRRYRRRRTAVLGAGTSALVVAVAGAVLAVAGGRDDRGGGPASTPAVWSGTSAPHASASLPGGPGAGGGMVDCFSNFQAEGDWNAVLKAQADCRRAEGLWREVFPEARVSGARNPTAKQVTDSFLARIRVQDASAPTLYGRAQPLVIEDWREARQEEADAGFQSWSGFNIATAQGTITVSAAYRSAKNAGTELPCPASGSCYHVTLSDNTVVELSSTDAAQGFTVTVAAQNGDSYRISFSNLSDPRYVDVPCEAPGGHCYADLDNGAIRPGLVPDAEAVVSHSVVTETMMVDILHRPAFAGLVRGFFDSGLGQGGS